MVCSRCGKPLDDEREEYCYDCSKKNCEYTQGKALWIYQGEVKDSLYRFKYHHRQDYARYYGSELARVYGDWIGRCGIQAVVPIPLSRKRLRLRGYNQAELIAGRVAARFGWNFTPDGLVKVRDTGVQSTLPPDQRRKNVRGAYAIGECDVAGKRVLVIDDIFTTGSTMMELTHLLKSAGAKEVLAATACITRFGAEELPEQIRGEIKGADYGT